MTTREQIIAAAKEASKGEPLMGMTPPEIIQFVERFYAIAFEAGRIAEREEGAKVCESTYPEYGGANPFCFETPVECAEAIRERGDTK